jgi:hypothetical protein
MNFVNPIEQLLDLASWIPTQGRDANKMGSGHTGN